MKFIISILCVVIVLILIVVFKPLDSDYDGIWVTEGYHMLFDINKGKVTTYQVSGHQLTSYVELNGKVKKGVLNTPVIELSLVETEDKISAVNSIGLEIFKMSKLGSLKDYIVIENKDDPQTNFDVFWQTFESNYPFFDKFDVDWTLQKETFSKQIQKDTSTQELLTIFKTMIADLNDDHVYIQYNDEIFTPYQDEPKWHKDSNSRELVQVIEQHYIDDLEYSKDKIIRHGHLSDKTGYILIATFGGYDNEGESIANIEKSFVNALNDLQDTDRLILDLRFNRGGFDSTGIALATHLVTEEKLAYKRQIKDGDHYTNLNEVYIQPSEPTYKKEIIILTSGASVSAAETFALSIKDLDNVMIIGEATAGFYSDMLERKLPNGMTYGLPHMRYYSNDDLLMEGEKIQPEVHLPIDLEMMYHKKDPALDWILENKQ